MLNHNKIKLAVISALLWPAIGFSEPAVTMPEASATKPVALAPQESVVEVKTKPTATVSTSAKEIADVNERFAVLNARFNELEMKLKIATKEAELKKTLHPDTSAVNDVFVPSVAYIDGVDGKLKAALNVQGGNTQSVKVGDMVGVWKVKDIKMDSVTVQKGKEVIYLGFGSYTSNPVQPNAIPQLPR